MLNIRFAPDTHPAFQRLLPSPRNLPHFHRQLAKILQFSATIMPSSQDQCWAVKQFGNCSQRFIAKEQLCRVIYPHLSVQGVERRNWSAHALWPQERRSVRITWAILILQSVKIRMSLDNANSVNICMHDEKSAMVLGLYLLYRNGKAEKCHHNLALYKQCKKGLLGLVKGEMDLISFA